MFETELKIPKERVAVLIGKKGETKKLIERKTKTKLKISKEGDVILSSEEPVNSFIATPIVKAVGRGFNPEIALCLLNEENCLEIVNMQDFTGKSPKKLTRLKARLIGTKGKARHLIEKMTGTSISIYGKTVGIIGKISDVLIAKPAIEKILQGAPHGNVYKFIELKYKELRDL